MNNLKSQIVDIINNFLEEYKLVDARTCEGEFKGMHSSLTVGGANEVVKEIEKVIAQQVREARIDEIKRMREAMTFAHMTPSIYAAERIKNILGEVEL